MRRQSFFWTYLTLTAVLLIYGIYTIVYNISHDKSVPILGWIFASIGGALLLIYLVLLIISLFQKKKEKPDVEVIKEEKAVKAKPQEKKEEIKQVEQEKPTPSYNPRQEREYSYTPKRSVERFNGGSAYIIKVGYGPVLRVEEEEILDMRSNTYYRIEGNMVKQSGYGPVFEISGNRIKSAFGGYLYEISGSNINKTYGGYYASINGNIIQTYDLNDKYEISGHLNLAQKLAIAAILFGSY